MGLIRNCARSSTKYRWVCVVESRAFRIGSGRQAQVLAVLAVQVVVANASRTCMGA